jgi:hypothetical protein
MIAGSLAEKAEGAKSPSIRRAKKMAPIDEFLLAKSTVIFDRAEN